MFCNKCGSQIPDGMVFCPNCGNNMGANPGTGTRKVPDNIFTRITTDFNTSIKAELALWIASCVSVVLFLITIIMMSGIDRWFYKAGSIRNVWIFMFIFGIGSAVLAAFRLRGIHVMYSNALFIVIMLVPYYLNEKYLFGYIDDDLAVPVNIFFILALLASLAEAVCIVIDIFTSVKIKFVVMVLSMVSGGLIFCMIFFPYLLLGGTGVSVSDFGKIHFIMGSFTYFLICAVTCVYTVLYCKGIINNNERMFARFNTAHMHPGTVNTNAQSLPAIQCIKGSCQGQVFNIHGEIIIGSQQGRAHIILNDTYVSRQHCTIRFNQVSGCYEVRDLSSNGIFFANGTRMQRNIYISCPRETILYIGSANQQFMLL